MSRRRQACPRFWLLSLAWIAPALAISGLALVLPGTGDRVIVTVLGVDGLIIFALYVQPRLIRRADQRLIDVAHELLEHARAVREPGEVVDLLGDLLEHAGIADRALVVLRSDDGTLGLYGGNEADGEMVAELGEGLAGGDGDPEAIARLASGLDCSLVLHLRPRAALIGVAFVRLHPGAPGDVADWEPIRDHLTFLMVDRRLARALNEVEHSLPLGRSLQEALMPADGTVNAAGVIHHSVLRLTSHCGGDTWTARDLGDGKLLVFVGDATGHGPAAATLSAAVKGTVDGFALVNGPGLRVDHLFSEVDKVVRRIGGHRYLMSAVAAVIDLPHATVTIANAGHPRPFLVDRRDPRTPVRLVETGHGNLLGAGAITTEVRVMPLTPEAKWIFYTDGISEARVARGQSYGLRRFRDTLRANAHGSAKMVAESVLRDVDRFVESRPLDDDVVLVVVEIPAERSPGVALAC